MCPTFDPKDSKYDTGLYVLHKLKSPSIAVSKIGKVDFVLLSHDHHFDNLDNSGRKFLFLVNKVFTTPIGAERLGANSVGIKNWEPIEVPTKDNRILIITGTPCRHGPVGGDRGPVTGFVLNFKNETQGAVYITGDTVWYEGIEEVARRFDVKIVILFLGAAVVKAAGPSHLTMTAEEGIKVAKLFDKADIVPLHFESWEHFTESSAEIESKFKEAGLLKPFEICKTVGIKPTTNKKYPATTGQLNENITK